MRNPSVSTTIASPMATPGETAIPCNFCMKARAAVRSLRADDHALRDGRFFGKRLSAPLHSRDLPAIWCESHRDCGRFIWVGPTARLDPV
jgi:hypothetical protein